MGNFNRGRSGGGRGFERRSFNDRGSRGPVQMHSATCDNCHKSCEVPFRPTNGKPVFCSSCFENNRGSDSRRFSAKGGPASGWEGRSSERSTNFDDRQMFDAVCADCGNSCKVPFQPSGEKPVFCSNCFGDKKEGGSRNREQPRPQYQEQFEQLNIKLDRILTMLAPAPKAFVQAVVDEIKEEPEQPEEQVVETEKKTKVAKKKPSKQVSS